MPKTWVKNFSNKDGQILLGSAEKSTTDAIKTASKRAILNIAEATGDLIGKKIADKITSGSQKKPAKELPNDETKEDVEITTNKKDTYLQKKDNKLSMN